MIKLETFKAAHFDEIMKAGPRMRSVIDGLDRKQILPFLLSGPGVTSMDDKGLICAAGIMPVSTCMGESWLLATKKIEEYPLQIARIVRRLFGDMAAAMNMHRVQTLAVESSVADCRWLEWLGFQREGILRAYTPSKENVIRYSKLFGV